MIEYITIFSVSAALVFLIIPYVKWYRKLDFSYDNYSDMCMFISHDDFHYKLLMKNLRSRFIMTFYVIRNPKLEFHKCVKSVGLLEESVTIAKAITELMEKQDENCETKCDPA